MTFLFRLPPLSDLVTEVSINWWLKSEGDHLKQDEPLIQVGSELLSYEIPSPVTGVLKEICAAEDDTIAIDDKLAIFSDVTYPHYYTDKHLKDMEALERTRRPPEVKPLGLQRILRKNIRQETVFLCHSRIDRKLVRDLHSRLVRDGIICWFDQTSLIPGQNWRYEVENAIRSSRYALACLSNRSINKAGFVQKELRIALDVADEQPEGSIYLIPVRLEPCVVPTRLRHLHWVNLFERDGYRQLGRALQLQPPL